MYNHNRLNKTVSELLNYWNSERNLPLGRYSPFNFENFDSSLLTISVFAYVSRTFSKLKIYVMIWPLWNWTWLIHVKHGWGNIEMWEVFKFLLLCLISIIIGLTASFIYVCALLIVLVLVFYDFDFAVGLEHHAINKLSNLYLKVRKFYLKTTHVEHSTDSFLYTPTMNSINKQTSSFELSRFNKSGNALSPITNSASSTTLSSRRLVQARQTSTPLTKTPPWQQSATNTIRSPHINSSLMNRSPRYV